jgi:cytochrome c553
VPPAITESCGRCHGVDGGGRGSGAFPKLAGQKPDYFIASMEAYALGRRSSGIMEPIAVGLSREATIEVARHYASLGISRSGGIDLLGGPKSKTQNPKSSSAIERGREIAMRGIPQQRVPACSECHGPAEVRRNPHYPILAGQYADYLVLQLTLFQNEARGGTAYAHLMRPVAAGLTPEQMRDVALFYQSLQNN